MTAKNDTLEPSYDAVKNLHPDLQWLFNPQTIRNQAHKIWLLTLNGKTNWVVNHELIPEAANFVAQVTRDRNPSLEIPPHTRWNHFHLGGCDRGSLLKHSLFHLDHIEQWKIQLELIVTSVLLDAGAGSEWKYDESQVKHPLAPPVRATLIGRSEGLALASFWMYVQGVFSNNPTQPYAVHTNVLLGDMTKLIATAFQVSAANPLVGASGRGGVLQNLGTLLMNQGYMRLGDFLWDKIIPQSVEITKTLSAVDVLQNLFVHLGSIWPDRLSLHGMPLGDVWHYPLFGDVHDVKSLVPFHKLSQWLTYSCIQTFADSHIDILHANQLTGLTEYRNGGLFVDVGVLQLKDPKMAIDLLAPNNPLIVEWRALTLVLLDKIAPDVAMRLGFTSEHFDLRKVLEGGTWWAGRQLAEERRPKGGPPLNIISDGTVF